MIKATFTIRGNNLIEDLKLVLSNHHKEEKTVRYDFETGTVFMFDQYNFWSNSTYSLTVVLDENKKKTSNELIEIQCFVLGGKVGLMQLDFFDREKKCVWKFRDDLKRHSKEQGFDWTIEEMNFL